MLQIFPELAGNPVIVTCTGQGGEHSMSGTLEELLEHSHIMYGEKSLSKNSEIRSIPTLYFVRKSVIDKYCSKDPNFPYSDPY